MERVYYLIVCVRMFVPHDRLYSPDSQHHRPDTCNIPLITSRTIMSIKRGVILNKQSKYVIEISQLCFY